MHISNTAARRAKRLARATADIDLLRGHVTAGTTVPAGNYRLRAPLVLADNESLLLHPDAVIRPSGNFQGPLVVTAGDDVSISGGTISGATIVPGWREDGDGLWSAPYPLDKVGPCFSLVRNGEVKRISKWPQMRTEPVGSLRVFGTEFKASTPDGALDSTLAGGGSWTAAAVCNGHLTGGTLFQIGGETTASPRGVRAHVSTGWNGTVNTYYVLVAYDDGTGVKERHVAGDAAMGGLTVMVSYDAPTKTISISVNNRPAVDVVTAGINIPTGRRFTLSGNYDSEVGATGHHVAYFSTLAVWNRKLSDGERIAFWNNRQRFLWSELPTGLKSGCVGFWGFDHYDNMGHADVGPELIPRGAFSPSTTHGHDDGTVGLCPAGAFSGGNVSTWSLGLNSPYWNAWRPSTPVPGSETDVRIFPPSYSWRTVNHMKVTLDAVNQYVIGLPTIGGFTTTRSVIFTNVKSTMVPGTWCEKPAEGRIYYRPESGETLANSIFEIPSATVLLRRDGDPAGPNNRYDIEVPPYPLRQRITIIGTRFQHTRHFTSQHSPYSISTEDHTASKLPQHAAVDLFAYVNEVRIENCVFFNLQNRRGLSCDCRSDGFIVRGCHFDYSGGMAIAFGFQPGTSAGSENKNTLIEFCTFTHNGSVIAPSYDVVFYSMVDGFTFRNNLLRGIPYCGVGSHPARVRQTPLGSIVDHTHKNIDISCNHFDRYLTMASDGAASYHSSGSRNLSRNGNNALCNNLITNNEGYTKTRSTGYGEHAIYFDDYATQGWVIEDNVMLNSYTSGILFGPYYGPSDIQARAGGVLFYRNNLVSDALPFQFQFFDFNPDTMVELSPRTQVRILVDESERRLQLLYGTLGVEDAATGNISYSGTSFGPAANGIVAAWKSANPTGVDGLGIP